MPKNDLNLNSSDTVSDTAIPSVAVGAFVFRFAFKPVLFYVLRKWKLILAVFMLSVVAFWFAFHYAGKYSSTAWSATAKIFHQTRSEKIPTFYKPMGTTSVVQFIKSKSVLSRVSSRLIDSPYHYQLGMLSNIEVSMGKGKDNVITISASASTPETAAAIANAVAEEGVSEYVRRQNDSVKVMIDERAKQKSEISRELETIAESKKVFNSPVSGLSPDIELQKMRDEITSLMMKETDLKIRRNEVEVRMEEIQKTMKVVPETVQSEYSVDNTSGFNLEGKEVELQSMLRRYTEDNPKVRVLRDEIADLKAEQAKNEGKPPTPSKVSYRKNQVYIDLESQLISLKLEKTTLDSSEQQYKKEIEDKRLKIAKLLEVNGKYQEIVRRENMLFDKQTKLDAGVNDLEFLISSAVPDVYIFESASIPWRSNMRKAQVKIAALSLLVTALFAFCIAAFRIAKMHLLDSSEYKTALGIDDLGNAPDPKQYSQKILSSAVHVIYRNVILKDENAKVIAFFQFGTAHGYEGGVEEFLNIAAMQGVDSFRLTCAAMGSPESESKNAGEGNPSDPVAEGLVSVSKNFNNGLFCYQNDYSLDVAEIDLLKFDLGVLKEHYDLILIEVFATEKNHQVITQLAELVDYVVLVSPFDKVNKLDLYKQIQQIKSSSNKRIGGILSDIPKPYFKG